MGGKSWRMSSSGGGFHGNIGARHWKNCQRQTTPLTGSFVSGSAIRSQTPKNWDEYRIFCSGGATPGSRCGKGWNASPSVENDPSTRANAQTTNKISLPPAGKAFYQYRMISEDVI
jgi:hypothetical protein